MNNLQVADIVKAVNDLIHAMGEVNVDMGTATVMIPKSQFDDFKEGVHEWFYESEHTITRTLYPEREHVEIMGVKFVSK